MPTFHDVVSADGTVLRAWTNDADGPTVLLCNGLGTNAWCWPALLDPDCGVHVVSWNHRGTGGSQRPVDPERVGLDCFVEDAVAVLDDAGVDACPVVGWSIGVNTAFELAVTHPSRVSGLFAVCGVPGDTFSGMLAPLHLPRILARTGMAGLARTLTHVGAPFTAVTQRLPMGPVSTQLASHSGFMLPVADPATTQRALQEFFTTPVEWYARLALASSLHERVSLSSIAVPTSFVAATYDMLASAHDMRTASERIAGSSFTELCGSHFLTLEKPAEVHGLLLKLLASVEG